MNLNQDKRRLEILHLEDSPMDADLIYEYLGENDRYEFQMEVVVKEDEFVAALSSKKFDLILADFMLPGFDGFVALEHVKSICPATPFICVSGFIGEETAVELLKQGATDYVSKDKLGRLIYSIERALNETKEIEEKAERAAELQERTLQLTERTQQLQTMLTEKECIEQALKESENYYRTIFDNTGAATMVIEEDLTISRVNEECQRLLGYTKEDLIGKTWTDFIPRDIADSMKEYRLSRLPHLAAVPLKYQTRIIDRHGNHQDGLLAVDIIPGTNKSVVNFIDFTEFNRIDRALKAISAVNMAMVQAENEEDLLHNVCQKIMEVGGHSLVGVVYLQADPQQTVQPVASSGKDNGFLAKLNITLQDPKRGQGPTGTAIRTGQPVVCRDIEKNDTIKPWLEDALRQGFKASMSIPLLADNKAFGALIIYSSESGRFDSNEQILVNEMANDLGYAIMAMRTRAQHNLTAQELEMSLEKMQRILMQAVTSLGATLDTRDPYTAGHQRRVARLGAAIAEAMGLSKDQIEGISVTGNLHDIGKINVPSEILNKPGKLTDLEFAIIKTHPQAGYEIVKGIEFPWPVAEVLLQHHERWNGSGYPRGMAGEDILVEARIMAVADVVEAMSSHRPYRPALGIDATLDEIVQNRGILYDPEAVDACLKLFREKDFDIEYSC